MVKMLRESARKVYTTKVNTNYLIMMGIYMILFFVFFILNVYCFVIRKEGRRITRSSDLKKSNSLHLITPDAEAETPILWPPHAKS